jgi:hypothetical protein
MAECSADSLLEMIDFCCQDVDRITRSTEMDRRRPLKPINDRLY